MMKIIIFEYSNCSVSMLYKIEIGNITIGISELESKPENCKNCISLNERTFIGFMKLFYPDIGLLEDSKGFHLYPIEDIKGYIYGKGGVKLRKLSKFLNKKIYVH